MELRHLRYFVAVAEEQNVRRAAARLHVSQPPLTRQIRDLEDEIKVRLFERSKHGVQLTGAGRVFLDEARQILEHSERAVRSAQDALYGDVGRLRVAVPPMAMDRVLCRVLRQVRRRYPNMALQIQETHAPHQFRTLLERNVDLAYCNFRSTDTNLVFKAARRAAMCVALTPGHPLARQRRIPLCDLEQEAFIAPSRHATTYYDWYINLCRNAGFDPEIAQEADNAQTLLSMVSAGIGVALVPDTLRAFQSAGDVEIRDLFPDTPYLTFYLAWRRDDPSPALKAFLEIFGSHIEIRPGVK
ncbi:MAG TPA: LysR substrate-binding domain-containing protein [Candidatus Sulfotelmatobacter sp.]|nr:LysR substrate-binding domain-containing protein [Candidatus Sulfotelmatobacter sp.]